MVYVLMLLCLWVSRGFELSPNWGDDDLVDIFVSKSPLQNVLMSQYETFDAYHIGLYFQNYKIRRWVSLNWYLADDIGGETTLMSTSHRVPSDWSYLDWFFGYFSGDLFDFFEFENAPELEIIESVNRPGKFGDDLVHIGSTRGAEVKKVTFEKFSNFFDGFAIYNYLTGNLIRSGQSCFDYVEWVLGRIVWEPVPGVSILREGVVCKVVAFEPVDMKIPQNKRDFLRYLRVMWNHKHELSKHLVFFRLLISKLALMDMPVMFSLNGEIFRIKFAPNDPINHCEYPLEFHSNGTPIVANVFDSRKKCYLPETSHATWEPHVYFFWSDWAIWAEAKIDHFLSSRGAPLIFTAATTLMCVLIWRLANLKTV